MQESTGDLAKHMCKDKGGVSSRTWAELALPQAVESWDKAPSVQDFLVETGYLTVLTPELSEQRQRFCSVRLVWKHTVRLRWGSSETQHGALNSLLPPPAYVPERVMPPYTGWAHFPLFFFFF